MSSGTVSLKDWFAGQYRNKGYRNKNGKVEITIPPYMTVASKEEAIEVIAKRKAQNLIEYCAANGLSVSEGVLYDTVLVFSTGDFVSLPYCRKLKQSQDRNGYLWVKTSGKNAEQSHRVIAKCFLENPNNYKCVNHKDGIKTNNNAANLEWCSHSENTTHAYRAGLEKPMTGEDHPRHKLTEADVRWIRSHYKRRDPVFGAIALAEKFMVDRTTISDVANRKTWGWINDQSKLH